MPKSQKKKKKTSVRWKRSNEVRTFHSHRSAKSVGRRKSRRVGYNDRAPKMAPREEEGWADDDIFAVPLQGGWHQSSQPSPLP